MQKLSYWQYVADPIQYDKTAFYIWYHRSFLLLLGILLYTIKWIKWILEILMTKIFFVASLLVH